MIWIALDTGTTNTRMRLMDGNTRIAEEKRAVGVGDTVRTGSTHLLKTELHDAMNALLTRTGTDPHQLEAVVASGMIGSELGLCNVPHVCAPAGAAELASHGQTAFFPEICDCPFFFIPGLKNAPGDVPDVMRGEETECLGLMEQLNLHGTFTAVLPGSHNKLVFAQDGRLHACRTAMSGEILSAIAEHTLLKNALPARWPLPLEQELLEGCRYAQKNGMMNAMFQVRLMQTRNTASEQQRFSFFLGAGLADDLRLLCSCAGSGQIVIAGSDPMKTAFVLLTRALLPNPVQSVERAAAEQSTCIGAQMIWNERWKITKKPE